MIKQTWSAKNLSLYWKCQLIGWSAAALYWTFSGFIGPNFSVVLALIHFVLDISMYIGITHLFRNFSLSQKWQELKPGALVIRLIPVLLLLGLLFMILTITKNYVIRVIFEPGFEQSFTAVFRAGALPTFVAGVRLMAIWLLAYYFYHFSQREVKAVREKAELEIEGKNAQMDNLVAQINPHFFFNSLNTIKSLVRENPEAARRAIDLLSELLRVSIYKRQDLLVPLKDEMALVKDYLELEKMRYEERLQISIHPINGLEQLAVPPLSIQSLVENSIKHGIAHKKEGGIIEIDVEDKEGYLVATIKNPGHLSDKDSTGIGLKNLRARLALQYHGNAALYMKEENGTVCATLKIPLA